MTENLSQQQQRPWYKEPWLWLVIALPLSSVVAGISTVIIAYRSADDMVVDDYYKVGMSINQNIESEQKAKDLGLRGKLFFSGEKVQLHLSTVNDSDSELPQKLMLEMFHPTLEENDVRVELMQISTNLYSASFSNTNISGRRYLRITPLGNAWNLKQEVQIQIGETVTIDAQ